METPKLHQNEEHMHLVSFEDYASDQLYLFSSASIATSSDLTPTIISTVAQVASGQEADLEADLSAYQFSSTNDALVIATICNDSTTSAQCALLDILVQTPGTIAMDGSSDKHYTVSVLKQYSFETSNSSSMQFNGLVARYDNSVLGGLLVSITSSDTAYIAAAFPT